MFNIETLKKEIIITKDTVECPVKGCFQIVKRQRNHFKRHKDFLCKDHNIYISPSTFEYCSWEENLLTKKIDDLEYLRQIINVKRENRMARERSEDSLTWNIFRYLENSGFLSEYLKVGLGIEVFSPEVFYWSYCKSENGTWNWLKKARIEFELVPSRGSEPDIIIACKNALIIIEVKLVANNITDPSNKKVDSKYISGGQGWWKNVIRSSFENVAIKEKKYELIRFWLLGT